MARTKGAAFERVERAEQKCPRASTSAWTIVECEDRSGLAPSSRRKSPRSTPGSRIQFGKPMFVLSVKPKSADAKIHEHEGSDGRAARECKTVCSEGVNQVSKNRCDAEQVAAAGSETRGNEIGRARGREEQHCGEIETKCDECCGEGALAVAEMGGVECAADIENGPDGQHCSRTDLSHGGQGILSQRDDAALDGDGC